MNGASRERRYIHITLHLSILKCEEVIIKKVNVSNDVHQSRKQHVSFIIIWFIPHY